MLVKSKSRKQIWENSQRISYIRHLKARVRSRCIRPPKSQSGSQNNLSISLRWVNKILLLKQIGSLIFMTKSLKKYFSEVNFKFLWFFFRVTEVFLKLHMVKRMWFFINKFILSKKKTFSLKVQKTDLSPWRTSKNQKKSLLRRLQEQTLPDEAPPMGKIHPLSKIAVTFEPEMRFECPLGFRIS